MKTFKVISKKEDRLISATYLDEDIEDVRRLLRKHKEKEISIRELK